MSLQAHLREHRDAVVARWLEDTLSSYAEETQRFLQGTKDPFANPVGHALREGMPAILDGILGEAEAIRPPLDAILKIRAVQEFSPSQAVSFVFLLKGAVRTVLGGELPAPEELEELERGIERAALLAFDLYLGHRERVFELRMNEMKRSVAAMMRGGALGAERCEPAPPPPGFEGIPARDIVGANANGPGGGCSKDPESVCTKDPENGCSS